MSGGKEIAMKKKTDIMADMATHQGYVPPKCTLPGPMILLLVQKGEDPCHGCNMDRSKCDGRPRG